DVAERTADGILGLCGCRRRCQQQQGWDQQSFLHFVLRVREVRMARAGGCAPPELQPVPLRKGRGSGIIIVCLYLAGLFRAKDTEVCVNDPTGALWGAQTTVLPSGGD